jgi:hypothetical protein
MTPENLPQDRDITKAPGIAPGATARRPSLAICPTSTTPETPKTAATAKSVAISAAC